MYETIILGAGPAGVAAGVYAARKKMKALLITENFGGQSVVSVEIHNWIGTKAISGVDLAKNLEEHLRSQESIEIRAGERIAKVEKTGDNFKVITNFGVYETKTVIVTSGARRRKLNVSGEKELAGKGVAYCATCDAPLFRGKAVAVVGSGNAGLEAVMDLLPYAKEIYILSKGETINGDPVTLEKIKRAENFKAVIFNASIKEIFGDNFVSCLKYCDLKSNEEKILPVQGVFVEIGSVPNSEPLSDLVKINERGEIVIDHKTGATSAPGIFAAGDIVDSAYKQSNIAAGDAIKAALSAYSYLQWK